MQKIVILGNPHSGTTILKSIIGHIDDVHEIYKETQDLTSDMLEEAKNKKYILIKVPRLTPKLVTYYMDNNFIIICIIRNPLYTLSSIKKRMGIELSDKLRPTNNYIKSINTFVKYNSYKNIYTIKYEDIFNNNYEALKIILDKIGFKYNDNIFNNEDFLNKDRKLKNKKINSLIQNMDYEKLSNKIGVTTIEHNLIRLHQINQPFKCMNDDSKINITSDELELLKSNKNILDIYPQINNFSC